MTNALHTDRPPVVYGRTAKSTTLHIVTEDGRPRCGNARAASLTTQSSLEDYERMCLRCSALHECDEAARVLEARRGAGDADSRDRGYTAQLDRWLTLHPRIGMEPGAWDAAITSDHDKALCMVAQQQRRAWRVRHGAYESGVVLSDRDMVGLDHRDALNTEGYRALGRMAGAKFAAVAQAANVAVKATGERARRIAAVRELADWLEQHPDVPMPERVMAWTTVSAWDEVDEATRVAGVIAFADAFDGAELDESSTEVRAAYEVVAFPRAEQVDWHKMPFGISYHLSALLGPTPSAPARRYVQAARNRKRVG